MDRSPERRRSFQPRVRAAWTVEASGATDIAARSLSRLSCTLPSLQAASIATARVEVRADLDDRMLTEMVNDIDDR